jgi:hypothetical protein
MMASLDKFAIGPNTGLVNSLKTLESSGQTRRFENLIAVSGMANGGLRELLIRNVALRFGMADRSAELRFDELMLACIRAEVSRINPAYIFGNEAAITDYAIGKLRYSGKTQAFAAPEAVWLVTAAFRISKLNYVAQSKQGKADRAEKLSPTEWSTTYGTYPQRTYVSNLRSDADDSIISTAEALSDIARYIGRQVSIGVIEGVPLVRKLLEKSRDEWVPPRSPHPTKDFFAPYHTRASHGPAET